VAVAEWGTGGGRGPAGASNNLTSNICDRAAQRGILATPRSVNASVSAYGAGLGLLSPVEGGNDRLAVVVSLKRLHDESPWLQFTSECHWF
jgi:hypothetical protein